MGYPGSRAAAARASVLALGLALALVLTGCGAYPADPDGTLERVRSGTLRVGASENGAWVELSRPAPYPAAGAGGDNQDGTRTEQDVRGSEAELVRGFAERLGADIEWTSGAEHVLAEELKHGELDLVIGGLDEKTPWAKHGGLTRPYAETRDSRGSLRKHVMLVPMGENAFLLELDKFLKAAGEQQ